MKAYFEIAQEAAKLAQLTGDEELWTVAMAYLAEAYNARNQYKNH